MAAKQNKIQKLLIFVHVLLPYRANGSAVCLPFSIGPVQPYCKNSTAVGRIDVH